MQKALYLLAALSLAASPASGQILTGLDGHESDGPEVAVFMRPISGQSPEVFAMHRLVVDALETSRQVNRVDVPGDNTMQIEAPMELIRLPNSRDVLVRYEIWPIRGMEQSFRTTCPADHAPPSRDLERRRPR